MENERHPAAEIFPASPDVEMAVDGTGCNGISPPAHPSVPSLRVISDLSSSMTVSSTPLGQINAARRGGAPIPRTPASMGGQPSGLNQDILAKMKAFSLSRQGAPPSLPHPPLLPHALSTSEIPTVTPPKSPIVGGGGAGGLGGGRGEGRGALPPLPGSQQSAAPSGPVAARLSLGARPHAPNWSSAPSTTGSGPTLNQPPGGLAAKRLKPGLKLSDAAGMPGDSPGPRIVSEAAGRTGHDLGESAFSRYSDVIDTKAGTLRFKNKAIIHGGGIEFSTGQSFSISLDEVDRLDELGKGNYGTVYKVCHSRPHMRKPGLGLRGIISRPAAEPDASTSASPFPPRQSDNLSGIIMAMKEIRLELDEKKFAQIIMELDILHRCVSPFIIDFYGAFFQEGAVYICVEYMDGGSVDNLYGQGIPEKILRKITLSTVMGLKTLKDDHNIIHRDVKPTNILANTRGQVKICDFGVSGNLVASIAKTNIGCQSYMAPERISGGGIQQSGTDASNGTYSIQSDVWSLGLSIIECAIGRYPYPPETYNNIFSQLNAIVHGDPPTLPRTGYSDEAHAFVHACLNKNPNSRPTYAALLRHPWLAPLMRPPLPAAASTTSPESSTEAAIAVPPSAPSEQVSGAPAPPLLAQQASDDWSTSETEDVDVAAWVKGALERRERGLQGHLEKPALHTVALDAVVGSPILEDPLAISEV